MKNKDILEIKPIIEQKRKVYFNLDFQSIKTLIKKAIFKNSKSPTSIKKQELLQNLLKSLPLISYSNPKNSNTFSFSIICHSKNFEIIENFISEILQKKINKKNPLEILEKHSSLFKLSDFSSDKFYIIEYFINSQKAESNIKNLIFYLKLFINSISNNLKKENISKNQKALKEIYELILLFNNNFITKQPLKYLNKIIDIARFLKNKLTDKTQRNISLEFINSNSPHKLGIVLCMNIIKEKERFGKNHIIYALKSFSSNIQFIEESFMENKNDSLFFLEIEKEDKSTFNIKEKKILKERLKVEIENRIEHITPHIFTQKNEEEILKNIVLLSNQLKYVNDIPQVIINYEKQTASHLIFSVILLRILKKKSISIEKSFLYSDIPLNFIPDDIKIVGSLKKYQKEANIFKISIKKEFFYRKDFSLDSQKARIEVASKLEEIIGEFRDYNGSLIKQQTEAFENFKESLEKKLKNSVKVEKFFYSIKPTIMQTAIKSDILKQMFDLTSQLKITKNFALKTFSLKNYFLIAIGSYDSSFQEPINNMINKLKILNFDITECQLNDENSFISGYIIKHKDIKKYPNLYSQFSKTMHKWQKQNHSFEQLNKEMKNLLSIFSNFPKSFKHKKELRISLKNDPLTIDPRKNGDLFSSSILFMLFSGLTECKEDGSTSLSLAKDIKISKDKKTYIFYLKDNIKWSDGKKITAYDFEASWKKILDPDFSSPCKYLLNPILNAEKASQGKVSIEEVGIKSINEKILEINLTNPTPYFLSITSFCSLFPIPECMEKIKNLSINKIVNNGPFLLKKWTINKEIVLEKNPFYWNAKEIILDSIHISIIKDENKILQMFEKGKIDWADSSLSSLPQNILNVKNSTNLKKQYPVGGTTFCFFNVDIFPFNNKNIRKAFGLAIDRKKIIKEINLSDDQIAKRCIPPIIMNDENLCLIKDNDVKKAKILFEKGLEELKISKEDLNIQFYFQNEKLEKIQSKIMKEHWEKTFKINIDLKYLSQESFHEKLNKHEMPISLYYYITQYPDPMAILERFKDKKLIKNYSNWENEKYQTLIKKAKSLKNIKERNKIIEKAEKLLMEHMPISPIYHHKYLTMIKKSVKGISIGPLGEINFNKAYLK